MNGPVSTNMDSHSHSSLRTREPTTFFAYYICTRRDYGPIYSSLVHLTRSSATDLPMLYIFRISWLANYTYPTSLSSIAIAMELELTCAVLHHPKLVNWFYKFATYHPFELPLRFHVLEQGSSIQEFSVHSFILSSSPLYQQFAFPVLLDIRAIYFHR